MIIIINGPLGIGKTEVSWKLVERFERAVMLDGDYIGAVRPFEIYDDGRIEYLYQTLRHLAAWHVAHDYHNFVVNYVFETPESLAHLRQMLSELDDEIYAFRLGCSEVEMECRVRQRARDHAISSDDLNWELQRFRELVAIQEAAARRGDMGFLVDTTSLDAAGAAAAIWNNIREGVELLPYDPAWAAQFSVEKERLQAALGSLALEIHHIGSTAVPGLEAKPVIDILVVVRRLVEAEACIAPLQELGYTFVDYPQNTDRRFFRKGLPRTHHLHIVEQGSPSMRDHLGFRDALRADPTLLQQYRQLKLELAARYRYERAKYSDSKTAFVDAALQLWRARSR